MVTPRSTTSWGGNETQAQKRREQDKKWFLTPKGETKKNHAFCAMYLGINFFSSSTPSSQGHRRSNWNQKEEILAVFEDRRMKERKLKKTAKKRGNLRSLAVGRTVLGVTSQNVRA